MKIAICFCIAMSACTISSAKVIKKPVAKSSPAIAAPISNKNWNFSFSPLSILVGVANVEADYRLMPNWTVGLDYSYLSWKESDVVVKGSSILALAKYYFKPGFEDSWFAGGGLGTVAIKASYESAVSGIEYSAEASGAYFRAGGGYHWFWQSFNQQLGAYLVKYTYDTIEIKDSNGAKIDSYTPSLLGIEYKIGWAF